MFPTSSLAVDEGTLAEVSPSSPTLVTTLPAPPGDVPGLLPDSVPSSPAPVPCLVEPAFEAVLAGGDTPVPSGSVPVFPVPPPLGGVPGPPEPRGGDTLSVAIR